MTYSSRGSSSQRPQQQRTQQSTQQRTSSSTPPPAGAGNQAPAIFQPSKQKLFEKFGAKFGIDPDLLVETLKKTCFRGQRADAPPITNEQLVALLIVADQYGLNPFTKEIYAYPDKNGGIVPVVSVDGWIRIIQEHEQFDGMDIRVPDDMIEDQSTLEAKLKHKKCWEWIEVEIHRRDRKVSTPVVEFFDEVYRPPLNVKGADGWYMVPTPWQSHTKRMMRHKGIIQAGRVVFGFAGIYDDDEAQRIVGGDDDRVVSVQTPSERPQTHVDAAKEALKRRQQPAQAHETAQAHPQQPEQRREPAPQPKQQSSGEPWDDEFAPDPPAEKQAKAEEKTWPPAKEKERWVSLMLSAKSKAELTEAWEAYIAAADAAQMNDLDLDVESNYQFRLEKLGE